MTGGGKSIKPTMSLIFILGNPCSILFFNFHQDYEDDVYSLLDKPHKLIGKIWKYWKWDQTEME